jgi:hypothetical protein
MNFGILYEFLESLNQKFILKMEKMVHSARAEIGPRPRNSCTAHGWIWLTRPRPRRMVGRVRGVCLVVTALRPRVAARLVAAPADQGWQHKLEQTKGGVPGKVKEAVPHETTGRRGGGEDGGTTVFPRWWWRSGGLPWPGEVLQHRTKKGTVSSGSIGRKTTQ